MRKLFATLSVAAVGLLIAASPASAHTSICKHGNKQWTVYTSSGAPTDYLEMYDGWTKLGVAHYHSYRTFVGAWSREQGFYWKFIHDHFRICKNTHYV